MSRNVSLSELFINNLFTTLSPTRVKSIQDLKSPSVPSLLVCNLFIIIIKGQNILFFMFKDNVTC